MTTNQYIGAGVYSIFEVARLIRTPAPTVHRWAKGYTFVQDGRQRSVPSVIRPEFTHLGVEGLMSFQDLIGMRTIRIFRENGISLQAIRRAAEIACERWHTVHPFAVKMFQTDGYHLFAVVEYRSRGSVVRRRAAEELPNGQYVMEEFVKPFFKQLDFDGDHPRQYWPLGKEKGIVLDPAIAFGEPIDAESGVPTATLYHLFRGGESVEDIASSYRMKEGAVRAALDYEQLLAA